MYVCVMLLCAQRLNKVIRVTQENYMYTAHVEIEAIRSKSERTCTAPVEIEAIKSKSERTARVEIEAIKSKSERTAV